MPRKFKLGTAWYVLVQWANGSEQSVGGFVSEDEAKKWIETDAALWVEKHPKSRYEARSASPVGPPPQDRRTNR